MSELNYNVERLVRDFVKPGSEITFANEIWREIRLQHLIYYGFYIPPRDSDVELVDESLERAGYKRCGHTSWLIQFATPPWLSASRFVMTREEALQKEKRYSRNAYKLRKAKRQEASGLLKSV